MAKKRKDPKSKATRDEGRIKVGAGNVSFADPGRIKVGGMTQPYPK
jgi:hypothetical protein